jgi:hypothetical protein
MTSPCFPEVFGSDPAIVKWQVVRGDTATLRIEFYENDEVTLLDTSGWDFASSVYDPRGNAISALDTEAQNGYVDIIALPEVSSEWGTGVRSVVSELAFDLQVIIDGETVWTPVIGTITVIGDVTGGTL